MKSDNPFTLTFGKKPLEYISRYEDIENVLSTFTSVNPVSQTYLIEGIRGSGKTVLITSIASEIRQLNDWIVVDLNSTQNLIDDLALRLEQECRRIPELLKNGFSVSFAGFGLGLDGSNDPHNSVIMIDECLSMLSKKNKRILITIDEVAHNENMRHFAGEFQLYIRKGYQVFLLMTGLYENIYSIQNDPLLTFLLRAPKIDLEPLSIHQIIKAYNKVFGSEDHIAQKLAEITKGYAFAFQALGMLYFEYRSEMTFDDIVMKLDDMLDDFVYKKIWSSLSEQDRRVILKMTDDKIKVADLCERLQMKPQVFTKYRERLYRKGLVDISQRGYISLALPRFSVVAESYTLIK